MCGIAAIISPHGNSNELGRITALLEAVRHRGSMEPTSQLYDFAALGCARLDIVDSPAGAQPMEAGSLAIAFNGEIYNHAELRRELQRDGAVFRSHCDTEVVLQSYARWGEDVLDRLEGMYAFVIIDRLNRSYMAARDPYGIKPLYYVHLQDIWYFSSEIYPLLGIGGEIQPFPAGGYLLDGRMSGRVRYEEIEPESPGKMTLVDAIAEFRGEFASSVERHLPPDGMPFAVFCSGGIDSSAVLYESVEACRRRGWDPRSKLTVYSVGTPTSEDPKFAARLAAELDVPFVFEEISTEDMLSNIPKAVRVMESFEPNHIRAGTTSLAISRRVAADGFKVALLGEGADELLGGYPEFPAAARAGSTADVESLIRTFSSQLHRTQLRRVDRTSMHSTLEARVPFLDRRFSRFVNRIPTEYRVHSRQDGVVIAKHVLREAFRGRLPDYIVDRPKIPMGEGAGMGDNRQVGPFFAHSQTVVSDAKFQQVANDFPQFGIRTKEEALYFSDFHETYGSLSLATDRPRTNVLRSQ
jgi:asparagine synthase (glutamine-hydrolysing)